MAPSSEALLCLHKVVRNLRVMLEVRSGLMFGIELLLLAFVRLSESEKETDKARWIVRSWSHCAVRLSV